MLEGLERVFPVRVHLPVLHLQDKLLDCRQHLRDRAEYVEC